MQPKNKLPISSSSAEELESFFKTRDDRLLSFDFDDEKTFPLIEQLQGQSSRYGSERFYAKGGSKQIFKVYDQSTGRFIAMGCLREEFCNDKTKQEQFLREARITSYLSHPNIMPVYNIGFRNEQPFFTMKLIEGDSLSIIIRELRKQNPLYRKKYTLNKLIDIFVKVCDAMAYAHSRGVIHLDLKPDNIRVNNYGEVLVCDWGIARVSNSPQTKNEEAENIQLIDSDLINEITLSGIIKGTPGYMAPEQIKEQFGSKTAQTDVYALGSILYSILTYHSPLDHLDEINLVLAKTIKGMIPPPSSLNSSVPKSLEAICLKAMNPSQQKRYKSVSALLTDVQNYQHNFITNAENVTLLKIIYFFIKRHKTASLFLFFIAISNSIFMYNLYQKEKKATHNLDLYKQEREMADYFNEKGFEHIFKNFKNEFGWKNASANLKIANYMLTKNPDSNSAMGLKGLALFAQQDYQQAKTLFKTSNAKLYQDLIQLCELQQQKIDHLSMLKALYEEGRFPLTRQSFEFIFNNEKEVKKKEEWLKELIVIFNKGISKESIRLSCRKQKNGGLTVSVTAPKAIVNLDFLRHLAIETLKINNMKQVDLSNLEILPVKRLNLANTQLESFEPLLKMPKLRFLILDEAHKVDKSLYEKLRHCGIEITYVPTIPAPPKG